MHRHIFLLILALTLSSCSFFQIHKPIIEQGNLIQPVQVAKLRLGMSEAEVQSIMGKPILRTLFSQGSLNYIYSYQVGADRKTKKLICSFARGRLSHINRH